MDIATPPVDQALEKPAPVAAQPRRMKLRAAAGPYRTAILVYLGTRLLLLAVAALNGALRHHAFLGELAWWDGQWYQWLAHHGYPTHVLHARSTLGFFPLYPILIRFVASPIHWFYGHSLLHSIQIAGVLVSTLGGGIATVLVQRLATGWWGERSGVRAAIFFAVFPGSVVFSMVYAEGILIPLAAGCILALEHRRWLTAGVLAGLATASEPEALVLILVCAVSAGLELRRRGLADGRARRSLWAPLLSLSGAAAFAGFLWVWTGTPFASMLAQRYGWNEKTDPFALVHLARSLGSEISFTHFNHPTINLNLALGLLGALYLLGMLALLWRSRQAVSVEAIVWTLGIGFLAITSEYVPPNPRLLITAFPVVLVVGRYVRGRAFAVLATATAVSLAGLSALTFVGTTLRP